MAGHVPTTTGMPAHTYPSRALVLRARPLGEKDRVLTLFSAEKGRHSAVAKGARGTKSKLAAVAQPFVLARFLLARGRSLDIITQAQIENLHAHLTGDLLKTGWASYVCELADTLPEDLPDQEALDILLVTLDAIDAAPDAAAADAAGAWFEAQWLRHQGYSPTIGQCVSCGEKIAVPLESYGKIPFSPEFGGTLCPNCAPMDSARLRISPGALRALHRLERSRRPLPALNAPPLELDGTQIAELFSCLHRSLETHTGIRLRSRQFLDEIRADRSMS